MWKIVGLQWVVGVAVCLLMLLVSPIHAQSAAWGFVAVALPSTLFAARLALGSKTPMGGTIVFLAGEFLKVGATIAIMFVASQVDPNIVWWSLILTAIVTLKSYFLAFFLR
ncbi:MAG: ATP synthase subunit I [Burkholderiales bacterium]|jgi:ATP synthase protein I|uniref:ATP synthase subunit I n=1 Tax=Limnobacter sp. TaxID=2003368 RepID=UPI003920C928|nr:ATP synthase subunit I [Burkholderiales bacterium]